MPIFRLTGQEEGHRHKQNYAARLFICPGAVEAFASLIRTFEVHALH